MTVLDQHRLANDNFVDSLRVHTRFQCTCEWREEDGVLCIAGATDYIGNYFNCAYRTDIRVAPEELKSVADRYFESRNRGYAIPTLGGVDDDVTAYLSQSAFRPPLVSQCMILDMPLPAPNITAGVSINTFETEKCIDDFIEISSEAYAILGLEPRHTKAMFGRRRCLSSEDILGFVAYRNGSPAAAAFTLITGESAGIYWVGTVPAAQRLGLATLCATLATNTAFAKGAQVVTLQATKLGYPAYSRLGFSTYCQKKTYRTA